jgi:hypothetical protein
MVTASAQFYRCVPSAALRHRAAGSPVGDRTRRLLLAKHASDWPRRPAGIEDRVCGLATLVGAD